LLESKDQEWTNWEHLCLTQVIITTIIFMMMELIQVS